LGFWPKGLPGIVRLSATGPRAAKADRKMRFPACTGPEYQYVSPRVGP